MSKQVPIAPSRRRRKASSPITRDESETGRHDQAIWSLTETLKPFGSVELVDICLQDNIRTTAYPGGKLPMDLLLEAENSNWLDFTDMSKKEGSKIDMAEDFRIAELTQRVGGSSTPLTSNTGKYKRKQVDETPTRLRPMTPVDSDSRFLELLGNDDITFTENHENDMCSELGRSGIRPALKRSNSLTLLEEPLSQDFQRSNFLSSRGKPSTQDTSVAGSNRTTAINAPNIVVTLNNTEGSLVNLFEPAEETPAELRDKNMEADENKQAGADTGMAKYKPTPSSMFEVQADVHQDRFEDVTSPTLDNMNEMKGKGHTVPRVRSIPGSIVGAKLKDLAGIAF